MSDSAAALLTAVQTKLKATAAVTALVGTRIYGSVPGKATYPYVRISCTSEDWSSQTFSGQKHILRAQAFSQDGKPGIPLAIRSAVYDALNRNEAGLALAGGNDVILIAQDGLADCFPEEDGKTYQAVIEFSVLIQ